MVKRLIGAGPTEPKPWRLKTRRGHRNLLSIKRPAVSTEQLDKETEEIHAHIKESFEAYSKEFKATKEREYQRGLSDRIAAEKIAATIKPKKTGGGRERKPLAEKIIGLVKEARKRRKEITYGEIVEQTYTITFPTNPEKTKSRVSKHSRQVRDALRYYFPELLPKTGGKLCTQ
jgi:hypothetical protein